MKTTKTPKAPKRTIRQNAYGTWVGYVGRARMEDFGDDTHAERLAQYWLETGVIDHHACYN